MPETFASFSFCARFETGLIKVKQYVRHIDDQPLVPYPLSEGWRSTGRARPVYGATECPAPPEPWQLQPGPARYPAASFSAASRCCSASACTAGPLRPPAGHRAPDLEQSSASRLRCSASAFCASAWARSASALQARRRALFIRLRFGLCLSPRGRIAIRPALPVRAPSQD